MASEDLSNSSRIARNTLIGTLTVPGPTSERSKDELTPTAPDCTAEILNEFTPTLPRVLQEVRPQLMERYTTGYNVRIGEIVVRVVPVVEWRLIQRLNVGVQRCGFAVFGPYEEASNRGQRSQDGALCDL